MKKDNGGQGPLPSSTVENKKNSDGGHGKDQRVEKVLQTLVKGHCLGETHSLDLTEDYRLF